MLGNFGVWEMMIILLLVLLLFGAKRIPEIAGSMGKGIREFKKNINDATREINSDSAPRYDSQIPPGEANMQPGVRDDDKINEPKRLI